MALDGKKQNFDLCVVRDGFKQSYSTDHGLIYLDGYITAFRELCRFFKLIGNIFAFVARDLGGKIDGLALHRESSKGEYYETVQSMIHYETSNNIISQWRPRAGCKCLLTLHRALEFILEFIQRIFESPDEEKTSQIAVEVYDRTLSKHHYWIVRQMAHLAILTLPSRQHLVNIMCKQDYNTVLKLATEVLQTGQPVYDNIQRLYNEHDLLEIS